MSERLIPARAVSPGRILKRELEAHGWTQKDLAQIMGRPPQAISEIVRGKKQITTQTALELATALGGSAQFWMNLETNYGLAVTQHKEEDKIARRSFLYNLVPIGELSKRGWITSTNDVEQLEKDVCSLLGISSLAQKPLLEANLRHGKNRLPHRNSVICWVNRVKRLAAEQSVVRLDRSKLERAIPEILDNARFVQDVGKIPALLGNIGIHFLIVPNLPRTYVDGAAFFLGQDPVVALTIRYDRVDAFWFTLMHELAHIVAGHEGMYLDDLDEKTTKDAKEKEANRMATNWLVDEGDYGLFVKRTEPHFSRAKITAFAESQHRHPAIVIARLQYEGFVGHNSLHDLFEKVTPYLGPWIDVAERNNT